MDGAPGLGMVESEFEVGHGMELNAAGPLYPCGQHLGSRLTCRGPRLTDISREDGFF